MVAVGASDLIGDKIVGKSSIFDLIRSQSQCKVMLIWRIYCGALIVVFGCFHPNSGRQVWTIFIYASEVETESASLGWLILHDDDLVVLDADLARSVNSEKCLHYICAIIILRGMYSGCLACKGCQSGNKMKFEIHKSMVGAKKSF